MNDKKDEKESVIPKGGCTDGTGLPFLHGREHAKLCNYVFEIMDDMNRISFVRIFARDIRSARSCWDKLLLTCPDPVSLLRVYREIN